MCLRAHVGVRRFVISRPVERDTTGSVKRARVMRPSQPFPYIHARLRPVYVLWEEG